MNRPSSVYPKALTSGRFIENKNKNPKFFIIVVCCSEIPIYEIIVKGNKVMSSTIRNEGSSHLGANTGILACEDGAGCFSKIGVSLTDFNPFKNIVSSTET